MEWSEREGEGEGWAEPSGKHSKWCHLVMSKPRASRLTIPTLRDFLAICFAHFLQDDRSDLAYSAMILIWYWEEEEEAIADFFMEAHFGGVCLCRLPQVASRAVTYAFTLTGGEAELLLMTLRVFLENNTTKSQTILLISTLFKLFWYLTTQDQQTRF